MLDSWGKISVEARKSISFREWWVVVAISAASKATIICHIRGHSHNHRSLHSYNQRIHSSCCSSSWCQEWWVWFAAQGKILGVNVRGMLIHPGHSKWWSSCMSFLCVILHIPCNVITLIGCLLTQGRALILIKIV